MSYHSRQPSVASSLLSSSTFNTSQINKIGPWKLGKTLGRGSTGRVLLAENINTNQKAAVKVVSKSILNNLESSISDEKGRDAAGLAYGIEREIIIMKLLNHPNVLRLYDVWETSKSLYLILEYVEGGELFDLLVEKGPLLEKEAIRYFTQIILGASYCHALGICHRDLKPENLLLDHDLNIKIADFGMAALENNDRLLETSCGSPHYAAPEIVSGKHYHGFESDVWSCGVILFALLTGRLPFDDENIRNLLLKVQNGVFEMPQDISIEAQDLISKMLTVEPSKRIKTHEILNHPLLLKYPLNQSDLKTLNELPSPNTYLNQINSIDEIDDQILDNLVILWHGRAKAEIIENLLKPHSTTEKIFYFLLLRYRHTQSLTSNNNSLARSLSIAKSVQNGGSVSNSSGSSKTTTPKKNRRSVISVSSSHKKPVSFNTKNRRSIKDINELNTPPVPKTIIDEFKANNVGTGITKSTSKRRSMRTSILTSKRNSITTRLISVYAKLANDNDWEYIDKEAKRTSSNFATLCDEIFDHEKYEKLRLEKEELERQLKLQEEELRKQEELERQKLEDERIAELKRQEETEAAKEPKLQNNKIRSTSGPTPQRNSQLLDKDEISKIQQRAISHPLESRPKSKLDPAIRRSKFLGSKFDLDLKRQSISNQQKQVSKNFEDEKIVDKHENGFNGPKTIAEVKIPQVTRKSRHFSNSNKRLSVLSIYSTRNSFTNLTSLKELDNNTYKPSPLIPEEAEFSTSKSKSSGLRLSYADRLTALQESQEESTPVVNPQDDKKLHADDSMYKGLNIPDLPDHYEPIKPKRKSTIKVEIHDDDEQEPEVEPKPLPKPKRSAPSPPKEINPSVSTTKVTKAPLGDVTNDLNNKRTGSSGGGFFRKWSLVGIIQFNKRTLNTVYESTEMYQTLKRLLLGWNDYGLKNIKTNDELLLIEGEISKNNIMSLNSTRFKLNIEQYGKKGSCIKFEKLKGSTKSFKTLINEIERILNRENVLAFSN
ncbi:unnamed protein product [Wickerhamomyces anomalus]